MQRNGVHCIYLAIYLHCRAHGSVSIQDVQGRDILLDVLHIDHACISSNTADPLVIQEQNNIFVSFPHTTLIKKLHNSIYRGLNSLHRDLTKQLFLGNRTNNSRQKGKVIENEPATNVRVWFGFGRVQVPTEVKKNWKVLPWKYNYVHIPRVCYKPFTKLPDPLRPQLWKLFESAQSFVESKVENPFGHK